MQYQQVFLTSDQHFFHEKIAKLRGYSSSDEHTKALCTAWNNIVKKGDRVYILGDIIFYSKKNKDTITKIIQSLNGQKYLIKGNHDSVRQWDDSVTSKFEWIRQMHTQSFKGYGYNSGKLHVHMCHYPIESWNKMHYGGTHAHGHQHADNRDTPGRLDIGVDKAKELLGEYRPFTIEEYIHHSNSKELWEAVHAL